MRIARIPQCASETFTPKRRLSIPVRIGFPTKRLRNGIASPWIVPSKREPMTRSSPGLEPVDERRELLQRVRLVGVSHDDVVAAGLREACEVGAAVAAAAARETTRAPCAAATSAERSVDALSTTITSPGRPERRIPSRACSTTLPTASSSFRQGMTTEICGVVVATGSSTLAGPSQPPPRRLPSPGVPDLAFISKDDIDARPLGGRRSPTHDSRCSRTSAG